MHDICYILLCERESDREYEIDKHAHSECRSRPPEKVFEQPQSSTVLVDAVHQAQSFPSSSQDHFLSLGLEGRSHKYAVSNVSSLSSLIIHIIMPKPTYIDPLQRWLVLPAIITFKWPLLFRVSFPMFQRQDVLHLGAKPH